MRTRVLAPLTVIAVLITLGMLHFVPAAASLGTLGEDGAVPVLRLLLAIAVILAAGYAGGWLAVRLRQPRVVGEMIAGIALGPSLLGYLLPEAQHWLFPTDQRPHLQFIAQLAVIAFLFLFGANLPLRLLHGSGGRVATLGLGMVAIPVLCGVLLAIALAGGYRPEGVGVVPFVLFVGVAMGITAFPVLVRILTERGLVHTRIGALGLTAAGVDDAVAWCLLAIVIATAQGGGVIEAGPTVALLVLFAVLVWTVLRPALRRFLTAVGPGAGSAARAGTGAVLLLCAVSGAYLTDWIGVHAIFGAFLVGMAMPRDNPLVIELTRRIERGVGLVLPLFFAVVGLTVQLGLLSGGQDLLVCALVVLVAMVSKMGTTALLARSTRLSWRESAGLGVMVNCRGLTELVVVTTGLSLGVIGQDLFVMLVVMTLVTTAMTAPLLDVLRLRPPAGPVAGPPVGAMAGTGTALRNGSGPDHGPG